jgi:hypothetical protein
MQQHTRPDLLRDWDKDLAQVITYRHSRTYALTENLNLTRDERTVLKKFLRHVQVPFESNRKGCTEAEAQVAETATWIQIWLKSVDGKGEATHESVITASKDYLNDDRLRVLCCRIDDPKATHGLSKLEQDLAFSGIGRVSHRLDEEEQRGARSSEYYLSPTDTMVQQGTALLRAMGSRAKVSAFGSPTSWDSDQDIHYLRIDLNNGTVSSGGRVFAQSRLGSA